MITLPEPSNRVLATGAWILFDGDIWEVKACRFLGTVDAVIRFLTLERVKL